MCSCTSTQRWTASCTQSSATHTQKPEIMLRRNACNSIWPNANKSKNNSCKTSDCCTIGYMSTLVRIAIHSYHILVLYGCCCTVAGWIRSLTTSTCRSVASVSVITLTVTKQKRIRAMRSVVTSPSLSATPNLSLALTLAPTAASSGNGPATTSVSLACITGAVGCDYVVDMQCQTHRGSHHIDTGFHVSLKVLLPRRYCQRDTSCSLSPSSSSSSSSSSSIHVQ
jgi:hypothetical protein